MPHSAHSTVIFTIGDDYAVGAAHAYAESFTVHAFVQKRTHAESRECARSVVSRPNPTTFLRGDEIFLFDEEAGVFRAVAEGPCTANSH